MLTHPQFDPIALSLGPLAIRWYGLTYVAAFALFMLLGRLHLKRRPDLGYTPHDLDDLLYWGMLGVVLGGRLGYVLFYKFSYYLSHPIEVFYVWQGGMSFHGGFLGVLVAMAWFGRKRGRSFFQVTDYIAPLVPTGLAAGRIGNFINGELPGRVTDPATWPWAMWFPQVDSTPVARHPSQLYQFALEGITLFVILWLYSKKPRPVGAVSAVFLIGYGTFRFIAEFAREPDDFLGLLALGLSMGQWLSLPMVAAGVFLLWRVSKR
ncbi:MAG: prolipoprotein diacylglyceryl transferase [Betaproteobacteria bacterium]|nr:prolipoprotein diacylglyceryl transferase [Betaproteobacteria bacterium]